METKQVKILDHSLKFMKKNKLFGMKQQTQFFISEMIACGLESINAFVTELPGVFSFLFFMHVCCLLCELPMLAYMYSLVVTSCHGFYLGS